MTPLHQGLRAALVTVFIACAEIRPPTKAVDSSAAVVRWAREVDSIAANASAYEFLFPSRSTEGGGGQLFRLRDSSVRVDIDDMGETGRSRERFYARGVDLRLAVSWEEHYDGPMTGKIVRRLVDSTWFANDSAVRWVDSAAVVRVGTDSLVRAHGREVRAEYLWALHMAGTMPAHRDSSRKPYNER